MFRVNIYGPLDMGNGYAPESFHIKKLCTRFYSTEIEFYFFKTKNQFLTHPLGDFAVTYALHL